MLCGYSYVRATLELDTFEPEVTAKVSRSVDRLTCKDGKLLAPVEMAPKTDAPVEHLLFALKHENINLAILAAALKTIDAAAVRSAVIRQPSSQYARVLGFLWEAFNGQEIEDVTPAGIRVPIFNPDKYVVGKTIKNTKWGVAFNGLGTLNYCPIVRKTPKIKKALRRNTLARARDWLTALGSDQVERLCTLTDLRGLCDTYEVGGKFRPVNRREKRFFALLQSNYDASPVTETHLINFHAHLVSNVELMRFPIRERLTWVPDSGEFPSPTQIQYVPPTPELLDELLSEWMAMINNFGIETDSVTAAACASFGLIYLRPFLDGNERLSRFFLLRQLALGDNLPIGATLPTFEAILNNDEAYRTVVKHFSRAARNFWNVAWNDELGDFEFEFTGDNVLYRYWDATVQTEFLHEIVAKSFEVDLKQKQRYNELFDVIYKRMDEAFDAEQIVIAQLASHVMENGGKVSVQMRKRFAERVYFPEFFAYLEEVAKEVLGTSELEKRGTTL